MENEKKVLSIVAHPDDAEFLCTGTLALLAQKNWDVHIATMTPGDVGSAKLSREKISKIRRAEAKQAVALLKGSYHCLECDDVFITYDRPTLLKTIELIRKVRPTIVFTNSPTDYMVDHEVASKLTQTACLAATIPNVEIAGTSPLDEIPYLYYLDPTGGKDILGQAIKSDVNVDISSTMEIKRKMLRCHESQRSWLLEVSKVDEYIIMMEDFAKQKGCMINCKYAEGFRQHLGFSYPQDNILKSELGEVVHL